LILNICMKTGLASWRLLVYSFFKTHAKNTLPNFQRERDKNIGSHPHTCRKAIFCTFPKERMPFHHHVCLIADHVDICHRVSCISCTAWWPADTSSSKIVMINRNWYSFYANLVNLPSSSWGRGYGYSPNNRVGRYLFSIPTSIFRSKLSSFLYFELFDITLIACNLYYQIN